MGLETFTGWIKDLVATNPPGTDDRRQGDDHIRGIKQTLKAQFSGFTQGKAITITEDQLNNVPNINTTANSANTRAFACLPKDGSEHMTGQLYCDTSMVAKGPISVARPDNAQTLLQLILQNKAGAQPFDGLTLNDYSGANTRWLLQAVIDANGIMTQVKLGDANCQPMIPYTVADSANATEAVNAQWVKRVRPQMVSVANSGALTITGGGIVLCATAQFRASDHESHAIGVINVANPGAAATVTITLRWWSGGGVLYSKAVAQSVQGGFTENITVSDSKTLTPGTLYYVELIGSSTVNVNVGANMANILVNG